MHDVARLAGVSQMTVSRVMRESGYISDSVRSEVYAAARKIGYVHNRLAGGISAYENLLVGVVVPTLQNRVFTDVLSGISDTLDQSGLRPVFGVSEYSSEAEEELVFDLLSWRPRGIILPGLEHNDTVRQIVAQTGVRVAEFMDVDGEPMSACFGVSHAKAGADMAKHLLDRGYRTFGYVASQGGQDLRAIKRLEAFSAQILSAGGQILERRLSDGPSSMVEGRRMTGEILSGSDRPQALYYANDDLAAGGLMHCLAEGISVPDEVAVAGFNGLEFLSALPLQITTTRTPRYEIGVAAAHWISGDADAHAGAHAHEFEASIIVGDTT
ncbi:MAG: LacI family DNA-binding transcriptional regulator [Pseudomonadota bacterium]